MDIIDETFDYIEKAYDILVKARNSGDEVEIAEAVEAAIGYLGQALE